MDKEVELALQNQMNHERLNEQKYRYLADCFRSMSYDGFAKFFDGQAAGEQEHADKFADFLNSQNVTPIYQALPSVELQQSVPFFAEFAFATELGTTDSLTKLYALAEEADEYIVCALLDWFLMEQIEEMNWSRDLVTQTHRTDATGWMLLDSQYK